MHPTRRLSDTLGGMPFPDGLDISSLIIRQRKAPFNDWSIATLGLQENDNKILAEIQTKAANSTKNYN